MLKMSSAFSYSWNFLLTKFFFLLKYAEILFFFLLKYADILEMLVGSLYTFPEFHSDGVNQKFRTKIWKQFPSHKICIELCSETN